MVVMQKKSHALSNSMALRRPPIGHQALTWLEFVKINSSLNLICSGIDYGQTEAIRVIGTLHATVGVGDRIPCSTSTTLDVVPVESGRGTQDHS